MIPDWLTHLAELRGNRLPAVLVTIASVKGSVPRGPGTKMVVTADRTIGTIGGGQLEYIAIDAARGLLAADGTRTRRLQRFALAASLGQCCGGIVNLLLEPVVADEPWIDRLPAMIEQHRELVVVTPIERSSAGKLIVARDTTWGALGAPSADAEATSIARALLGGSRQSGLHGIGDDSDPAATRCLFDVLLPPAFDIVLFGAGHVARALVNVLQAIPCAITWVDSRDDAFPPAVPSHVRAMVTDAPEAEVDAAPAGAYFLVMTHSHPIDEALTERILQRSDFAYFGLIGSLSKRRQFERRLAARGMSAERFAAMTCPIGIPGIDGKEPGIIAVAVAAQLLQRRAEAAAAGEPVAAVAHERSDSTVHASGWRG